MTDVTMKAKDTLFISAWSSENIPPHGEFRVSANTADDLEARGLAVRVGGKKAEPEPDNKAEPAPKNKAAKPKGKK